MSKRLAWFRWCCLFLFLLSWTAPLGGCAGDVCNRYFQELKRRCRLNSTREGAKLDDYLTRPFLPCQLEICDRSSLTEIDCSDPETHVPGGLRGRFLTCGETSSNE